MMDAQAENIILFVYYIYGNYEKLVTVRMYQPVILTVLWLLLLYMHYYNAL